MVGSGQRTHLAAGTQVTACKSWKQATSYVAKYMAKPETFAGLGGAYPFPARPALGRLEAARACPRVPVEYDLTDAEFFRLCAASCGATASPGLRPEARRIFLHLPRERGRPSGARLGGGRGRRDSRGESSAEPRAQGYSRGTRTEARGMATEETTEEERRMRRREVRYLRPGLQQGAAGGGLLHPGPAESRSGPSVREGGPGHRWRSSWKRRARARRGASTSGACSPISREHPDVRLVVAHKLDRMYRNFADHVHLESELGVRVRYVVGDMPDYSAGGAPAGRAALGGPLLPGQPARRGQEGHEREGLARRLAGGRGSDRVPKRQGHAQHRRRPSARSARRHAFERYATGLVSLDDLAERAARDGPAPSALGTKVHRSSLHGMLRNPVYCGIVRYKGELFQGKHEPIISLELFEKVQRVFEPNRNGNKEQTHLFALRDFLWCGDCGCKITAERQKGHVYYRCTHGKGREVCDAADLHARGEAPGAGGEILASIEIGPRHHRGPGGESRLLDDAGGRGESSASGRRCERGHQENRRRPTVCSTATWRSFVDKETYQRKAGSCAWSGSL